MLTLRGNVRSSDQEGASGRRTIVRRLLDYVFGYDFFISYAWADGGPYAEQLCRHLEQDGYDVFLDRDDYSKGDDWKRVGAWTLNRTSQLILIGSPEALTSEPVAHELEVFARTGRRIVPIDFGGSLKALDPAGPLHRHLPAEILRIQEAAAALASGPSAKALAEIRDTFKNVRQDRKRVRVLWVVVAVLAALAVSAAVFAVRASINEGIAQDANRRTERALVAERHERERALRGERAAQDAAAKEREARAREATARAAEERQRRRAEERQQYAETQRRIAEQQRRTAELRQREAVAGQRFTQAARHFAQADAADSAGEAELLRRHDLIAQTTALNSGNGLPADPARQLRLNNLRAEIVDAERQIALFAQAAREERIAGRAVLADGRARWSELQAMGGGSVGAPSFAPAEPALFAVEVLSVRDGQSLLLHYGRPEAPRFVLIDGGGARVFRDALEPRLQSLRQRWSPGTALPLELVAVSNQDAERLDGIVRLFDQIAERQGQGGAPEFSINRVWHNTFGPTAVRQVPGSPDRLFGTLRMRSRALMERLSLPINAPFDHLVMRPQSGRLSIELPEGLRATILGPDEERLRDLFELWERSLGPAAPGEPQPAPLLFPQERFSQLPIVDVGSSRLSAEVLRQVGRGISDRSVPNRASLIILFEYGDQRFLHTGDANGDQVLAGLDAAGLLDEAGRITVDALLLPHMGSDRNVSTDFFSRVRARRYLFTGNGRHNNPENSTLEMLLEGTRGSCIELHFLNREGVEDMGTRIDSFFAQLPEGRYCYRRIFRSGNRGALTIDLLGRVRY